jgi:hypothetical protein
MVKVILKDVRLAFPAIHEADAIDDGEPRFGGKFIFSPKSANAKIMEKALSDAAKEQKKWEKNPEQILTGLKKKDKVCFYKEPYAKKDGTIYAGFEGNYYVSASNESRPNVKDRDGKTPLVAKDGKPYGGCYCNIVIDVWAQDNKWGQRVNATLLGVQFVRDGDKFAGGAAFSDDDFEDEDLGVDGEDESTDVEEDDGADGLA